VKEATAIWQNATRGESQTLLISGEPGIGKTRLLREIAARVEVSGGQAIVGSCYSDVNAPYTAFEQITRQAIKRNAEKGLQISDFVLADLLSLSPNLKADFP